MPTDVLHCSLLLEVFEYSSYRAVEACEVTAPSRGTSLLAIGTLQVKVCPRPPLSGINVSPNTATAPTPLLHPPEPE